MSEQLKNPECRQFICGLAFDFCVLDSAVNARQEVGMRDHG